MKTYRLMTRMMKETTQLSTQYFKTYEQREDAFRKSVFSLIPRKYSGPRLFWKDFGDVSLEELLAFTKHPLAYITSNPRDGLAFGTPWQVLRAAAMCARKANHSFERSVENIAGEFGLDDLLHQPIRTLSGGETVKLALAKVAVASTFTHKLVIASPFSWLSRENAVFFQKLFDLCGDLDNPVELFALEGEDCVEAISDAESRNAFLSSVVDFNVRLKNLRILLGSSLNPIYSHQTHARVDDFNAALGSPCLIVGENGRGKSLVAKALAGAIPFEGQARITGKERSGPARLLFQDVINQTMLRSFDAIAASAVDANGLKPIALWQKILNAYGRILASLEASGVEEIFGNVSGFRSLLEVKAILIAVRLCGQPAAIILDEPDWGLNRTAAVALVAAVIEVAHELKTPVVLISHKPWWRTIAKSTIRVDRTRTTSDGRGVSSFDIRLRCD